MINQKKHRLGIGALLSCLACVAVLSARVLSAQAPPTGSVDNLLSAAKGAAGLDWAGTFLRLCIVPPPAEAGPRAAGPPPKDMWYAEPARVADNFYFIGTRIHSAWALVGSDGIVIFEALFDYAAPDEIAGGLKTLGLDIKKVKYIVISHAHADHDGGAKFLQDTVPSAHLVYGGPDWDAIERAANHAGGKPKRDIAGTDGMKLSVGDASVQIVTMPGHTPGTLSFLFEIKDQGKPLRVAYVGGTAIPFNGAADFYDGYLASAKKMAKAAEEFGATVLLSNHTEFDGAYYKAHAAANHRKAGANPFHIGRPAVARYFTVVEDCASAAKLRATGEL
jgi:metallo-beta-lactamase class B